MPHVRHTRYYVAPIAAPRLASVPPVPRLCRARRWIARIRIGGVDVVGAWARAHVPLAGTVADVAGRVEAVQRAHNPGARPVIRGIVVVGCSECEGSVTLHSDPAARGATRILYRQHPHTGLDAVAQQPTSAVDG